MWSSLCCFVLFLGVRGGRHCRTDRSDAATPAGHAARIMRSRLPLALILAAGLAVAGGAAAQDNASGGKLYRIVDGKVDAKTYNGFRRFHAGCNHCHGQDGLGSTFGPSLVERLPDLEAFRRIVRDGTGGGKMKGFAGDPNVAPYIDDIFAYLQARADGALDRGRPERAE
jgi:mono/diheme cytochrome c family protein